MNSCLDPLSTDGYGHVDQALPLLKAAWDRGVTTWDTANTYSNGESERIIGKALKQAGRSPRLLMWPGMLTQFL